MSTRERSLLLYSLNVPLVSHSSYISYRTPVPAKKTHILVTAEESSEMTDTHVMTPPPSHTVDTNLLSCGSRVPVVNLFG